MLIKNQVATCNLNNKSGPTVLLGAQTGRDSSLVARLRNAGVVILGTANLTQWGNSRDLNAGNGWSAGLSQTVGVYFQNQDPWGSSSGSAVGTAIGLSFAALGTEVRPSFYTAVNLFIAQLCGARTDFFLPRKAPNKESDSILQINFMPADGRFTGW